MAPEICAGKTFDGQQADIYAVGASIYYIRFGKPPFEGKTILQLYSNIQNKKITFPFDVSDGLQHFILRMTDKNPCERCTITKAMRCPWLQKRPNENDITMQSPNQSWQRHVHEKIEISRDDIFSSIHAAKTEFSVFQVSEAISDFEKISEMMTLAESQQRISKFQREMRDKNKSHVNDDFSAVINWSTDESEDDTSEKFDQMNEDDFIDMMDTLTSRPRKLEFDDFSTIDQNVMLDRLGGGILNSSLSVRCGYNSEKGIRQFQEDRLRIKMKLGRFEEKMIHGNDISYLGIFDGHNGTKCADLLKEQFHQILLNNKLFPNDIEMALRKTCEIVDFEIYKKLSQVQDTSGSTALIICIDIKSRRAYVANVGDSRCVLCKEGRSICLTKEHRTTEKSERDRVIQCGGVIKYGRVNGILAGA